MYVPHARKLCLRGRFPWLLASPVTAKSRHVVGREGSIFFLSLASQVQERYLSLHFCSQTKKSSGDWTPPLACAVEAVLKMICTQHGSSLTRRESAVPADAGLRESHILERTMSGA
jgi:hypothetical protein